MSNQRPGRCGSPKCATAVSSNPVAAVSHAPSEVSW
ncbi:Uncharacterised protein [Mycobacterium tuberculosis]|nr:Uncharacterised protein [Mycobacterium tuberculosis]